MILDKGDVRSHTLMSSPAEFAAAEVSLVRSDASYEDFSGKFKCLDRNFARQYAHIYSSRLNSMKDIMRKVCIDKFGPDVAMRKLSELAELKNERCVIVGTLYKRQELKPSILKDISEENQLVPQPRITNYISPKDQLILEDELQRIRLTGSFDVNKLVTGIVVAVLGVENDDGSFSVEDMVFGNSLGDIQRPITHADNESYILIVSGLDIGSSTSILPLQLLVDWISGELGDARDQAKQSKVCRVIIAGNSVKKSRKTPNTNLINSEAEDSSDSLTSIRILDKLLNELVESVEVDIMPGEFDPSNHTLPQQPIHQCIFPNCSKYESFHRVTNPYEFVVNGRRVLGTSGQPVNDIRSLTDFADDIGVLESTLLWKHIAPTAPDTLACYPYYKEDPFIIEEPPDVYFAGNVSTFETKVIHVNEHPVRLICLPVYAESRTCALVNLKTLQCESLAFKMFEGIE